MNKDSKPYRVFKLMYNNDPFSKYLGMELKSIANGYCVLELKVTPIMLNGFSIAHGGISYSLCDSALAFAANSHGTQCVSIETSISHVRPVPENGIMTATAKELHRGKTTGIYEVTVTNEQKKTIALFKGTVYNTGKSWFPGNSEESK